MAEEKTKKTDYEKALEAYSQAMKVFSKKDYEKAEELLKQFLEKFPKEKELIDRVHLYVKLCENSRTEKPVRLKSFDDYYQYSVIKINLGEYEEALKLLSKAGELDPKSGKIDYMMANTYCLMGNEEDCLGRLVEAIEKDPFFKVLAQNEEDFETIRENDGFKEIMGRE